MDDTGYWKECIEEALGEEGVTLSDDQLNNVAGSVSIAHECYGMAYYSPPSSEYLDGEIENLKRELEKERAKEICPACNGKKFIVAYGPYHSGTSQCGRCRGEGRV